MHILVVDDFVLVELALAQVIQDSPHTLVGVRDPRSLPEVLSQETHFDLALVDINFGPGVPTGLTAMRILQDLSPDTKIVIESTDEERNRLLFLLASFAFFEPLALMSKASSSAEMRAVIDAIDRGETSLADWSAPRCEEIPGFYATVRQDTREVLGIVGEDRSGGRPEVTWRQ